jgi:hypothetical protein
MLCVAPRARASRSPSSRSSWRRQISGTNKTTHIHSASDLDTGGPFSPKSEVNLHSTSPCSHTRPDKEAAARYQHENALSYRTGNLFPSSGSGIYRSETSFQGQEAVSIAVLMLWDTGPRDYSHHAGVAVDAGAGLEAAAVVPLAPRRRRARRLGLHHSQGKRNPK